MRIFRTIFLSLSLALSGLVLPSLAFSAEPNLPVNINTADAETLSAALKGVGTRKAEAIIAYRESYGPFKALEELTAVKGIGESLLNKNRDSITLE
ncbi:ComEA family DNA-binding protein [Oceanicoccus sagamiensis]|uniref:Competence protein ComEA n=1 Tax=Oceanicoccus sagamiensis TaxID=716816 RepID=A0A1X9N6X1_9GAMM|nr:ComEA family DNA-binding protein [Oceanicoccus sagamiensis]ARN72904.1 competence protein ComEA [Oceanicoccus sagamiensis]